MKILDETNKIQCECGTLLQYNEDDIEDGYIVCPCCGRDIKVRDVLKFPRDYHTFKDGVDIINENIDDYVKGGIDFLRYNPDEDYYFIGTGNTSICIFRNDDLKEFVINVCKNYYEGYVGY